MAEVIRKLELTALEPSEFDYAYHTALHEQSWAEKEKANAFELERARKHAAEAEKHAAEAEKAEKEMRIKAVRAFLAMGKDIAFIAGTLDLSIEETSSLAAQV